MDGLCYIMVLNRDCNYKYNYSKQQSNKWLPVKKIKIKILDNCFFIRKKWIKLSKKINNKLKNHYKFRTWSRKSMMNY